jgi:flagellar biosynthesis regulator FlaF
MYQFSYSKIFEEPPAPPPSRSRLISNAIELLGESGRSTFQPFEQRQLLSDFRRVWLLFADDLQRASQGLPKAHQARFLADMQSILHEVERRRFMTPARSAPKAGQSLEPLS